jgi:hypothetical protein
MDDLKKWTKWLAQWFCVWYALLTLVSFTPLLRDDTDPGQWMARSSLAPRTDGLTGCQYLAASNSGLTPRLDSKGRHVGCRE